MTRTLGLHQVSDEDLTRLLRALAREGFGAQVTRKALVLHKLGHLEGELDVLVGHERKAAIAIVSSVLLERKHRPTARAQLLWAGPRPTGEGSRDPYEALQELIATAERELMWAGVDLDLDARLLRSLHAAQRGRGLSVTLVLAELRDEERSAVRAKAESLFQRRLPLPEIYAPTSERLVSPLPRCMIADMSSMVLLTGAPVLVEPDESAVCSGVLVAEPGCATGLLAQHRVMIDTGTLLRLELSGG